MLSKHVRGRAPAENGPRIIVNPVVALLNFLVGEVLNRRAFGIGRQISPPGILVAAALPTAAGVAAIDFRAPARLNAKVLQSQIVCKFVAVIHGDALK